MSFGKMRSRFVAPRSTPGFLLCLAAVSLVTLLQVPTLALGFEVSDRLDPMGAVGTEQGNTHGTTQGKQQQERPAIASDGTYCLTVWQDSRAGWPNVDIYGSRLDVFSGLVLDTVGISISTAADGQYSPTMTFDGRNYLVVWSDSRDPAGSDIYGARIDTSGTVLDHLGVAISTATGNQAYPEVAFDGTNYLIVWADYRNTLDSDIYAARMDTLGVVLDVDGFPVSTAVNDQLYPVVAFDGTNYLVTWSDGRVDSYVDIYGARVTPSGAVLDTAGLPISTAANDQEYPDIAFDGINYFVVWEDNRIGVRDIYGARVDTSGAVIDTGGVAVSLATSLQRRPAVTFDGRNHFVVWEDYRSLGGYDVYGARVDTSATLLDATGIPVCTATFSQRYVDVAFASVNTDYVVVWQDRRTDVDSDVYAARVDTSGTVTDPDGITDVVFSSASARAGGDCVTLSWTTAVEVTAASFAVERSESREGGFVPINVPVFAGSDGTPGRPGFSFYCTDCSVLPGGTYWYRIVLAGPSGVEICGPIEVRVASVPAAYRMHQSYPNPFNPLCTIRFEIPKPGRVTLRVFDASGTLVKTLADGWRVAAEHTEVWDGRAEDGRKVPSGVYFYQLEATDFRATRKVVLLR